MSDELKPEQQEELTKSEVVEEVKTAEGEAPKVEEVIEPATEETKDDPILPEEKPSEEVAEEVADTEEPIKEEPTEEHEPPVEEKVEETIDEARAKLEEERAIFAEEKAIVEFDKQARADEIQMAKVEEAVGKAMIKSMEDLGVDVNKSIEEIRKEDPEKAKAAQQVILEAQATLRAVAEKQAAAAKERLQDIIFTKASRLLEKFGLSEEETPIVAETFVNILNEAGLKNLDDDLVAKIELAVGRAKLLVPKVVKAVDQVKEIAEDVKDTVNEIMTPAPEIEEKIAKTSEPVAELDEFKEGPSTGGNVTAKAGADLLAELSSISDSRERVKFYTEHFVEIEKALRDSKPNVNRNR